MMCQEYLDRSFRSTCVVESWLHFSQEAPATVATFLKLAQGQLIAPCIDEDEAFDEDEFGVSDRDKLTKKQIYRQCKAREDTPLSYEYSQVWRIAKDERIDFGR
jgi:hypothetical protein